MKRLFLLRHAKAVPHKPGAGDADRVLAPRGRSDATRMGRFLRDEHYAPDLVLCSTAARTRETLELVLAELGTEPAVRHLAELYMAEAETISERVRRTPAAAGAVMIVGHNPGIEECARALVHPPDDRRLRKRYDAMADKFPTGALAVVEFEVEHWSAVGGWVGELELFIRPKDLREDAG